jgi:probable rRNA maturation factor
MTPPTHGINIENDDDFPVDSDRLVTAVRKVLELQEAHPLSGVTLVIGDNEQVAALNRSFRGIDSATDVLSFPADPLPPELLAAMADEPPYLGDLIIAFPYARAQAEREGHPLNDSLSLLAVHGTLHLLGFDHDTPENRARMWAAQEQALLALAISPTLVPGLEDAPDDH